MSSKRNTTLLAAGPPTGVADHRPRSRRALRPPCRTGGRGHPRPAAARVADGDDGPDLAEAGRAIGGYDARPFVSEIDVPVASVVTTQDRLVPPEKQYDLARATGAHVLEFPGDHDAAVTGGDRFAQLTLDAIAAVTPTGAPAGDLRG